MQVVKVVNFVSNKVSTLISTLDEDEPDFGEDLIDDDPLEEQGEYPYEEGEEGEEEEREGEDDEPPYEEDETMDPNADDGSDPTSENASKDPPNNATEAATGATENPKDSSSGQQTGFQDSINNAAGILQTLKEANPNPSQSPNPSNDSTTPDQSTSAPPPQGGQQPTPPPQPQQRQQQLPPMGPGMGPNPMGIPLQPQQQQLPPMGPGMGPNPMGIPLQPQQQQQPPPMGPGMGPNPMGIPLQPQQQQLPPMGPNPMGIPQQPPPMGIPFPQPQQEQLSGPGKNPTQMGFPPPQAQPQQTSDPRMAPTTNPVSLGLVPCKNVQTGSESVKARVNIQNEQVLSQSQSGSEMAIPTPEQDAIHLHDAFKGSGCDVGRVVKILSQRDAMHRQRIKEEYSAKYAEGLDQRLSSELSGRFKGDIHEKVGLNISLNPTGSLSAKLSGNIKRAVSMWMLEEPERDAVIVGQGLALMSIDLPSVTEVICSRTPCQLQNLKRAYYIKYNSQLVKDIDSFTSLVMGSHKELLIACLDGGREEGGEVDMNKAEEDAKQLYKDGEKRWGTNEKTFIDVFTRRSRPQLAATDSAYHKLYGHSLEKALKKEVSGHFHGGLRTLLRCAKNPAKYFAEVLHKAMKRMGTSDRTLIRVVVTRAEIDMEKIKEEYAKEYKKSLKDRIQSETSDHYRTFLLNLLERGQTQTAVASA